MFDRSLQDILTNIFDNETVIRWCNNLLVPVIIIISSLFCTGFIIVVINKLKGVKMFNFVRNKEYLELQNSVETLVKEKMKLKEELEELKLKKRLEQEEITHMVKINEEKMKQEVESEKIALNKKYTEDIAKFKEEQRKELVESLKGFHEKIEKRFSDELKNLKEVYSALMSRLPNVNLTLEKRLK